MGIYPLPGMSLTYYRMELLLFHPATQADKVMPKENMGLPQLQPCGPNSHKGGDASLPPFRLLASQR